MKPNTDDKEFAAFIFDDVSDQKYVKKLLTRRDRKQRKRGRKINLLKEKL
ncbi:MAG: hypothetical protein WC998_06760 [Candidatus Paceibacterota bacterium]|jgi:deoxyxylulose-5-phosphate synthase